jgi:hypothetical protein
MPRPRTVNREADLHMLDEALRAFRQETGLRAERRRVDILAGRKPVDAVVRIDHPAGPVDHMVEVRKNLNEAALGQLVQKFAENPARWIVIAPYVPAHLAKKMRELRLQFMDTAGNTFIEDPPMLIFVQGNRAQNRTNEQGEEGLLAAGGIRIIFALLCQPKLLNGTYRELGAAAGTALGTVAGVMKILNREGYLIDPGRGGKKLMRTKELVELWTRAYALRFRRQQLIGRFATDRHDIWKDVQLGGTGALWGGEVAAHKLTHIVKPAVTTLYAHTPAETLIADLHLRRDDRGPIELRERFWRFKVTDPGGDTVPPLLVYADLLATADARNIETAQTVYDLLLKQHLT